MAIMNDYMLRRNELAREIAAAIFAHGNSVNWGHGPGMLSQLDFERIVADRLDGELIRFYVLAPKLAPTLKNAWLETAAPTRRGVADAVCRIWDRKILEQLLNSMSIVECVAILKDVKPFVGIAERPMNIE